MSAGEQLGLKHDAAATQGPVVEQHHVEVIPENERQGRPRDQFTLWFAANANVVNFTLGVLAILFGLNLFWALVAIVVGNVLGMLLTALHAWQGPSNPEPDSPSFCYTWLERSALPGPGRSGRRPPVQLRRLGAAEG